MKIGNEYNELDSYIIKIAYMGFMKMLDCAKFFIIIR